MFKRSMQNSRYALLDTSTHTAYVLVYTSCMSVQADSGLHQTVYSSAEAARMGRCIWPDASHVRSAMHGTSEITQKSISISMIALGHRITYSSFSMFHVEREHSFGLMHMRVRADATAACVEAYLQKLSRSCCQQAQELLLCWVTSVKDFCTKNGRRQSLLLQGSSAVPATGPVPVLFSSTISPPAAACAGSAKARERKKITVSQQALHAVGQCPAWS